MTYKLEDVDAIAQNIVNRYKDGWLTLHRDISDALRKERDSHETFLALVEELVEFVHHVKGQGELVRNYGALYEDAFERDLDKAMVCVKKATETLNKIKGE